MLVKGEIACDECGARIEPRQKAGEWKNIFMAKAHVCEGCWETELLRTLIGVDSWEGVNDAIKANKLPAETFIGRVVWDTTTERIMEKFGVSKT